MVGREEDDCVLQLIGVLEIGNQASNFLIQQLDHRRVDLLRADVALLDDEIEAVPRSSRGREQLEISAIGNDAALGRTAYALGS